MRPVPAGSSPNLVTVNRAPRMAEGIILARYETAGSEPRTHGGEGERNRSCAQCELPSGPQPPRHEPIVADRGKEGRAEGARDHARGRLPRRRWADIGEDRAPEEGVADIDEETGQRMRHVDFLARGVLLAPQDMVRRVDRTSGRTTFEPRQQSDSR